MTRSLVQYERDGRRVKLAVQNIDAAELRAIVVGLALVVKERAPRSVDVAAELSPDGREIAQSILRAFKAGPLAVVPERDGHLLT